MFWNAYSQQHCLSVHRVRGVQRALVHKAAVVNRRLAEGRRPRRVREQKPLFVGPWQETGHERQRSIDAVKLRMPRTRPSPSMGSRRRRAWSGSRRSRSRPRWRGRGTGRRWAVRGAAPAARSDSVVSTTNMMSAASTVATTTARCTCPSPRTGIRRATCLPARSSAWSCVRTGIPPRRGWCSSHLSLPLISRPPRADRVCASTPTGHCADSGAEAVGPPKRGLEEPRHTSPRRSRAKTRWVGGALKMLVEERGEPGRRHPREGGGGGKQAPTRGGGQGQKKRAPKRHLGPREGRDAHGSPPWAPSRRRARP